MEDRNEQTQEEARISRVRDFLCGYQMCMEMLNLRKYERKRAKSFDEEADCDDVLAGGEAYWRARMFEVRTLIEGMRNGREKLILYYHYIRGESIERAADLLGVSRRTGYRIHRRALFAISFLYENAQKKGWIRHASE